jgi:protein-tyrosine phosphatase
MSDCLFVCTGNWYRSRFCEEYGRYLGLDCDSRGLDVARVDEERPPAWKHYRLSFFTGQRLERFGIVPRDRGPLPLTVDDLAGTRRVILLDREEHRPMLLARFPEWTREAEASGRVEYWSCRDLPKLPHQKGYGELSEGWSTSQTLDYLVAAVRRLAGIGD